MEKNNLGKLLAIIGILFIVWGVFGGKTGRSFLSYTTGGLFMILIGLITVLVSVFLFERKWYWGVISFFIILLILAVLVLMIPFK